MNKLFVRGYTLVELVVSMTIISVALLGTLMAINTATLSSADPLILQQAISISESYLEEITAKDFPTAVCPPGTRATFTNICQYNGLSEPPTDQTGTVVSGLGGYTVSVTLDSSTASLGSPTLTAGTQVVRIDVNVSHIGMQNMTFSVYRTSY